MEGPNKRAKSSAQRPKQNKVSLSVKLKRKKPRLKVSRNTLDRCRVVRAANGLCTDEDLVLYLLNVQKKMRSGSSSSGASDPKVKFSRSKMKSLIQKEVWTTMENNETKLREFMETIQALDTAVNCERSMHKLEAHVNMLTKRAGEALTLMTQPQWLSTFSHRKVLRLDSEEKASEAQAEQKELKWKELNSQLAEIMETTKQALKRMHTDHQACRDTIAELSRMHLDDSPVLETVSDDLNEAKRLKVESTSLGCSDGLRETNSKRHKSTASQTVKVEESKPSVEPPAGRLTMELHSPVCNTSRSKGTDEFHLSHLGLPALSSPSTARPGAASYSLPQKLDVCMALIKRPPCLSVVWNASEKDPAAPPMDTYSVFLTMEKVKGSGMFQKWTNLGELRAIPLPVCVMISNYKPGHKVAVTVVGKDQFGRYGPFSKILTAVIPE